MERQLVQGQIDRAIEALASRQHGVVAWWQLRARGISRGAVDFRLANRRLLKLHRGVYAVGHGALSWEGRLMAAVLALGPGAILSHRSAAELWALLPRSRRRVIDVTVPRAGTRGRRAGIVVHYGGERHGTTCGGIPVTSVPETLLDVAATCHGRILERAVEGAERTRLFDLEALRPLLASGRPGVPALRRAVAVYDDAPARAELERRFLVLCREHELGRPLVNTSVGVFEVDFLWPDERLIVETDSAYHDGTLRRERDHRRDAELALAGYLTLRFGWRQVTGDAATVAAVVRRSLAERHELSLYARDKSCGVVSG